MIFIYCEVVIFTNSEFKTIGRFKEFGKEHETINNPYEYIKLLGHDGWEMISVVMSENNRADTLIYTFKKVIAL